MSFSTPKQLLSPPSGSGFAADAAVMLWETDTDESLARQDTWLLSFIDILALLLTLFVLLLAYQDEGQEQDTSATETLTPLVIPFDLSLFSLYSGVGLLPLKIDVGHPVTMGPEAVQLAPDTTEVASVEPALNEPQPAQAGVFVTDAALVADAEQHSVPLPELEGPPLPTPAEVIQQAFAQGHLLQRVDVLSRPGAVSVEISDNILFEPASAALSVAGLQLLHEVARVLGELPYPLSIEGHTDNVPISSSRFPSNWELSSARAAMATRALIEQGIAADRLRAIGYGDTRPRAGNDTVEGRAINRRVSFVLQMDEAGESG